MYAPPSCAYLEQPTRTAVTNEKEAATTILVMHIDKQLVITCIMCCVLGHQAVILRPTTE